MCIRDRLHDLVTGRSCTGILHLLNNTPIDWFSKRQNTVETATYGSELVACRTATEQVIEIRYYLRMLGVPIDTPTYMFGDNMSVVMNVTMPQSLISKRHNILSYHRVREAVAAGIIAVFHIDGNSNPADVLTKIVGNSKEYPLLKPYLFKNYMKKDQVTGAQSEGSVKPGVTEGTVEVYIGVRMTTETDQTGGISIQYKTVSQQYCG